MKLLFLAAAMLAASPLAAAPAAQPDASPSPQEAQSPAPPDQAGEDAADLASCKTADQLWQYLQKLARPEQPPENDDERNAMVSQILAGVAKFQEEYPHDPLRWNAKLMGLEVGDADPATVEKGYEEIAAATDANADVKEQAHAIQLEMKLDAAKEITPELEKEVDDFTRDFPQDPAAIQLQFTNLHKLRIADPGAASALIDRLLKSENPAVVQMAKGEATMRDALKKPLDLKFTAVDGTEVDLRKLRGKVVLVVFWATWCPPCMAEAPSVVTAYRDLHGKGLEVVGISLDQDKDRMEAVAKDKGMVWPESFDGTGNGNEIATRYGVLLIPRLWLVDRKGYVVNCDLREDLEEQIAKQLKKK